MTDPLSFPFLEGAALSGAVTFMYNRVSAALDRRAGRSSTGQQEEAGSETSQLTPHTERMNEDRVRRFVEYATWLRGLEQNEHLNGSDHDLRRFLGRIREELEEVYGMGFAFGPGEKRKPRGSGAVVDVFQTAETVDGHLRGVRARGVAENADVRIIQGLGNVGNGAEATGLEIDGTIG
ncbi:hypothetical protein [Actinomadura sp. NPDC048394]|jgi:hypothetical protein|uniref:hypothetical protein n=1 Tax=Actinomadura sp. NPDC048394 TaxID=3158223 RepID=UPI003406FAA6